MLCPCTVADDIYYIWLHFIEQRASHWSPAPTHFLPSCALMIPWVWSSSVEVILFLVGCLSDPVNYKLLYWRCRNRNPYLPVVAVGSFPLWVSRQSFAVIFPNHSGYFLCFSLCAPFFFSWCDLDLVLQSGMLVATMCAGCSGRGQNKVRREAGKLHFLGRRLNILNRGFHSTVLLMLCPKRNWS